MASRKNEEVIRRYPTASSVQALRRKTEQAATMKRPIRAKSLLVDYSKSKAATVGNLDNLKDLCSFGGASSSSRRGSGGHTGAVVGCSSNHEVMSVTTATTTAEEESTSHSSNSSFGLPDLDPLPSGSLSNRRGSLASSSSSKPAAIKTVPPPKASPSPNTSVLNERQSRRSRLRQTRQYQSMSNLHPKSDKSTLIPAGDDIKFSLRRLRKKSLTTGGTICEDKVNNTPLRSKTWAVMNAWDSGTHNDNNGEKEAMCSSQRFHNSLGNLNLADMNLDLDLDEEFGTSFSNIAAVKVKSSSTAAAAAAATQTENSVPAATTAAPTTRAQNRRAMLVRHSSVSALNSSQHNNSTMDSWTSGSAHCPGTTPLTPVRRHHSGGRRQMMQQMKLGSSYRSPKREDTVGALPPCASIDITPKSSRMGGSMRDLSLGRHSLQQTRRVPQLKKLSLDASSNHSRGNSALERRSTTGGMMGKVPNGSSSTRRDGMPRQRSSSRLMGNGSSRHNGMSRQMASSRRQTMGHITASSGMDDSSQFVTGSRIRRGMSARHLSIGH